MFSTLSDLHQAVRRLFFCGEVGAESDKGADSAFPAVIVLLVIAALTTYADWYIGMFKLKHPHVCKAEYPRSGNLEVALTDRVASLLDSVSDCGEVMFGKAGGELFGIGYWLRKSCPEAVC